MSLIVYKIIFKGEANSEENEYTLTFKEISLNKPIKIPGNYISTLKKLSQEKQHIINFQNIKEVIRIGDNNSDLMINYYIVILFIRKSDNTKRGFLIGNIKKSGDLLLGIWPFIQKLDNIIAENIEVLFDDLIKFPQNYSKICLIYS